MSKKDLGSVKLESGKTVIVKKPTVAIMKGAEQIESEVDSEIYVIANCTGLSEDDLNMLDYDEYTKLAVKVNGFLQSVAKMREEALK